MIWLFLMLTILLAGLAVELIAGDIAARLLKRFVERK